MEQSKIISFLILSNLVLLFCLYSIKSQYSLAKPTRILAKVNEYADPFEVYRQRPIDIVNASAVFNSVHGALKQKDANILPVGVTFIPAYIPPNTRFYHSTSSPNIPNLFEWIAMDYEFSYNFAPFPRRKARAPHRHHQKLVPNDSNHMEQSEINTKSNFRHPSFEGKHIYLYTFRTTKELNKVLLLDGASASKMSPEMDQQLILSRQENITETVDERISSEKICNWGKSFGLQGIIRLEIGYEIIICDFHKDLELISNVTLDHLTETLSFPKEEKEINNELSKNRTEFIDLLEYFSGYEHVRAGSLVNDGESRIKLDFSNMVTPLNRTYIDPNPYTRNISYIPIELRESLLSEIEDVYNRGTYPNDKTDWQIITAGITNKFGPMLKLLNNTLTDFDGSNIKEVGDDLVKFTFNFIRRYNDNNKKNELQREYRFNSSIIDYVYHTYPLQNSDILIYSSIFKVQFDVQTMIFTLFDLGKEIVDHIYVENAGVNLHMFRHQIEQVKTDLNQLLDTLQWSIFTECSRKCNWDEVCYVPSWGPSPFGWGPSKDYFNHNGNHYSIPRELKCVAYKDFKLRW